METVNEKNVVKFSSARKLSTSHFLSLAHSRSLSLLQCASECTGLAELHLREHKQHGADVHNAVSLSKTSLLNHSFHYHDLILPLFLHLSQLPYPT